MALSCTLHIKHQKQFLVYLEGTLPSETFPSQKREKHFVVNASSLFHFYVIPIRYHINFQFYLFKKKSTFGAFCGVTPEERATPEERTVPSCSEATKEVGVLYTLPWYSEGGAGLCSLLVQPWHLTLVSTITLASLIKQSTQQRVKGRTKRVPKSQHHPGKLN
jgi:hypothetical protein